MIDISYVPSLKNKLETHDREFYLIPGVDMLIIDYLLNNFKNLKVCYFPIKKERKIFVDKVVEIFKSNKNFSYDFFSIDLILNQQKNTILITDILKLGIFYSFKTLNPSLYYIPFIRKEDKLHDISELSSFIYPFTELDDLKHILEKVDRNEIKKLVKNFINSSLL